jgi:ribosomal-protein-serine acetyltransferase
MEQNVASAADSFVIRLDDDTALRAFRLADAEELFAAVRRNLERLRRWLPWATPAYSVDDTRRFLLDRENEHAARLSLTAGIWRNDILCGAIGMHRIDQRNGNTSIGYWIDGAYEGKGIVTAACRAMVTEGFRAYNLHRIEIRCATKNHRSCSIPRRLGFFEEGILREAEHLQGRWVDLHLFSMLARHWPGRSQQHAAVDLSASSRR